MTPIDFLNSSLIRYALCKGQPGSYGMRIGSQQNSRKPHALLCKAKAESDARNCAWQCELDSSPGVQGITITRFDSTLSSVFIF